MLNDAFEDQLKRALARAVDGVDVEGVHKRQLQMHYRPRGRRRKLFAVVATVVVVVAAVGLGWFLGAQGGTGQRLSLRLVADQVRLVGVESSTAVGDVVDIACVNTNDCIAVGPATGGPGDIVAASTDGGQSWTEQSLPAGVNRLTSLACASESACVAVGSSATGGPVIVTTIDGGSQWSSEPVPSTVTVLNAVACNTAEDCWAVGEAGGAAVLVQGSVAGPWEQRSMPTTATTLSAVGCSVGAAPAACLAVGSDGDAPVALYTTDGSPWSSVPVPADAISLTSANCADGALCTALVRVGAFWTQLVYSPGDGHWNGLTAPGDVPAGTVLSGVSACFTPSGSPCTPHDADVAGTVDRVVSGIASMSTGQYQTQTILSAFIRGNATSPPLSPVWYMGIAGSGLKAQLVLTSGQRNSVVEQP